MSTHVVIPFRAKRCDTFALELNRARVKASLVESKNGESRALRALEVAVRIYIAAAWVGALLIFALLTFGLPAFCIGLLIGYLTR